MLWWTLWKSKGQLKSEDPLERRTAAEKLGDLDDQRAVQLLIAALQDPDQDVRERVSEVLGAMGGIAVESLIVALEDPAVRAREGAARALENLHDARTIMPLILAASEPEYSVRLYANTALRNTLSQIGTNEARPSVPTLVEELVGALKHPKDGVRAQAADVLGRFGDERAIEPLIDALGDSSGVVRGSAASALGGIRAKRAIEPLIGALKDSDGDVRSAAAGALREVGGKRAIEPLLAALKDSSMRVRLEAVLALDSLGFEAASRPQQAMILLAHGKRDDAVELGADAVEALIVELQGSPHDEIVNPRAMTVSERSRSVRQLAAVALGKIGDKRAVEPLITALGGGEGGIDDFRLRREAAVALGRIGDRRAIEPLIATLRHYDKDVHQAAAEALRKIGAESAEVQRALSEEDKKRKRKRTAKLWRVERGSDVRSLVSPMSQGETDELVDAIDLTNVPLNPFCTDAFNHQDLDDRMVATVILASRLLELRRITALVRLLEKITEKFEKKLRTGAKRAPSLESRDPWIIGEGLMIEMHRLAIELVKWSDPFMDRCAVSILSALLLDYPERLESRFWLAATRHNLYMQEKSADAKTHALEAIDCFLVAAKEHPTYRDNVKALEDLRRTEY